MTCSGSVSGNRSAGELVSEVGSSGSGEEVRDVDLADVLWMGCGVDETTVSSGFGEEVGDGSGLDVLWMGCGDSESGGGSL